MVPGMGIWGGGLRPRELCLRIRSSTLLRIGPHFRWAKTNGGVAEGRWSGVEEGTQMGWLVF